MAPSCNRGPEGYCKTPSPIADPSHMHIPLWLWFRGGFPLRLANVDDDVADGAALHRPVRLHHLLQREVRADQV